MRVLIGLVLGLLAATASAAEHCEERGCWLALKSASSQLHVTFKDEAFFVPASLVGKTRTGGRQADERGCRLPARRQRSASEDLTGAVAPGQVRAAALPAGRTTLALALPAIPT